MVIIFLLLNFLYLEITFRETLLWNLLFILIYDTHSFINIGQNIEKAKEEEAKEIPESDQVLRVFLRICIN